MSRLALKKQNSDDEIIKKGETYGCSARSSDRLRGRIFNH